MTFLNNVFRFSFCKCQRFADGDLTENYKMWNKEWRPCLIRDCVRSRWLNWSICAGLSRHVLDAVHCRHIARRIAWHAPLQRKLEKSSTCLYNAVIPWYRASYLYLRTTIHQIATKPRRGLHYAIWHYR